MMADLFKDSYTQEDYPPLVSEADFWWWRVGQFQNTPHDFKRDKNIELSNYHHRVRELQIQYNQDLARLTEIILPTELSLTSKHGVEINVENTKDN
jgi:hypothetical protein